MYLNFYGIRQAHDFFFKWALILDQGIEVGSSSFIVQGALQLPQLRLNFCVKSRSHKVIVLI